MRRIIRAFAPLLLLPALSSCSHIYDLLAVAIDGEVAFVVAPSSDYQPDCVFAIDVQADDDGPPASPASGDDRGLVENGNVYWWDYSDVRSCQTSFPIVYGQPLLGPKAKDIDYVSAKPLKTGVVYKVGASGDGAHGLGWFEILPHGKIKNYRMDSEGYIVERQSVTSS